MDWVVLIPALPVVAFVVLFPVSRRLRTRLVWFSIAAVSTSLLLSVVAFLKVWPGGESEEPFWRASVSIGRLAGGSLDVGLRLDAIAAVMLLVVTVVGAAVQIYSVGYMKRDERIGWFYAVLSLFTAAMLLVVLSDNLLLFYVAWEIMGLCSYLLIGFWYEQEGARKAAQKAFLTTRVGDVAFAIGLFVIFRASGTFDLARMMETAREWAPGVVTVAALCLLVGAMGKSAQVPLHVWLPDAMAGPTPASALIHAATMVAAGVYLVMRTLPLFEISGTALEVTLVVGAATALVGGLLAMVQHDIKKVLAYSTISQLGYMFVALGAAGAVASLFHLVTHAFFKSLLFLGAGVLIHAAHTQDMREMGGLRRYMPWTTATFTVGSLALAGVFPFSGFWSKDEILTLLFEEGHYFIFSVALAAAFVTAFYVTRLWFRVFAGPPQREGLHEGEASMILPMTVLALITAVIGFTSPFFAEFLGHEGRWPDLATAAVGSTVGLAGILAGWWVFGRRAVVVNTRRVKQRLSRTYETLVQKLYFDVVYDAIVVRPYVALCDTLSRFDGRVIDGAVNGTARMWIRLTDLSWWFDAKAIDGAVNGAARWARETGSRLRSLESGRVQSYQRLVVGALVLVLVYVVVKGA